MKKDLIFTCNDQKGLSNSSKFEIKNATFSTVSVELVSLPSSPPYERRCWMKKKKRRLENGDKALQIYQNLQAANHRPTASPDHPFLLTTLILVFQK